MVFLYEKKLQSIKKPAYEICVTDFNLMQKREENVIIFLFNLNFIDVMF